MSTTYTKSHESPLHVLHIASGDLWAGAEVMLFNLAKAQHAQPHAKVTVVLLNHGTLEQKLLDEDITVYVIDESEQSSIQILPQLNKIVIEESPDVIHTHRNKENILGGLIAWRNQIPVMTTKHGASEHRPAWYRLHKHLIQLLDKLITRHIHQSIVAVSDDLARQLEQVFPRSKIQVIENGIDIAVLRKLRSRIPQNTNGDSYHVGIVGRLVPVKRVDLFIDAAVKLKAAQPELSIQYDIYGDGPLRDTVTTQVTSQQAENYIQFHGHCENITEKLCNLDALLMTSDHEGLPMVLLEAMSLEVPIIAHAVGGIPNLLKNGDCGTLVTEHTAQAFADAISKQLAASDDTKTRLALERVVQRYSSTHTAQMYEAIYHSIE